MEATHETGLTLTKSWVEAIAESAKCDTMAVKAFVKKHKIIQTPAIGRPKRINITSIKFSGKKVGLYSNDFEFVFEELGPGTWGLLTDGNSKGKSTALEIIKWLFKGKASGSLQSGVKSWMKDIQLAFHIDETLYLIRIKQESNRFVGAIERAGKDGKYTVQSEFLDEEEMADSISSFMLDQLEMEEMSTFKQGNDELTEGREVVHGWPSLAAAMFIGTDYSAIFGDTAQAGMTNRIMNMFMGLPWIPTAATLKTLEKGFISTSSVDARHQDWAKNNRQERLKGLTDELDKFQKERGQAKQPNTSNSEYHNLLDHYNQIYDNVKGWERLYADAEQALRMVSAIANEDEIKLRNFKEDHAANKVFKRLEPKCCPHCDRRVTSEDIKKERSDNTCAVCDHEMLDVDDSEEILADLIATANASKKALVEQRKTTKECRETMANWQNQESKHSALIGKYKSDMEQDDESRATIEKLDSEIARLKILKEEYELVLNEASKDIAVEPHKQIKEDPLEKKILNAAIKETELRYRSLQKEILKEVSAKMFEFCPKVGLGQYMSIELSSVPTLTINKDGTMTSFSKVSPGEKLRLKVIALLALISVAEKRGVGRHPGFLIIDSPASQDVAEKDLQELIGGLQELTVELPYLQVIIASKANPVLLELIPESNRKYANGDDFLW